MKVVSAKPSSSVRGVRGENRPLPIVVRNRTGHFQRDRHWCPRLQRPAVPVGASSVNPSAGCRRRHLRHQPHLSCPWRRDRRGIPSDRDHMTPIFIPISRGGNIILTARRASACEGRERSATLSCCDDSRCETATALGHSQRHHDILPWVTTGGPCVHRNGGDRPRCPTRRHIQRERPLGDPHRSNCRLIPFRSRSNLIPRDRVG